jgi:copper(I)-binding protein
MDMKSKLCLAICAVFGITLSASSLAQNVTQTISTSAIKIEHAYTRATMPGQQVAGGFMKIENKAGPADQLVSASSAIAGEVQLHEMAMEGNVMRMRQVQGIAVPAGGAVELKPGGLHIMFINIKAPLTAGETVPVKLKFAKAGEVEISMPVNVMGQNVKH